MIRHNPLNILLLETYQLVICTKTFISAYLVGRGWDPKTGLICDSFYFVNDLDISYSSQTGDRPTQMDPQASTSESPSEFFTENKNIAGFDNGSLLHDHRFNKAHPSFSLAHNAESDMWRGQVLDD